MVGHYNNVERIINPGLSVISWSSLNLPAYINSVSKCLGEFELLIDRVTGMHENCILLALQDIQDISLCHVPDCGTVDITDFYAATQELCLAASSTLNRKSQVLEKVMNEIIDMLFGPEVVLEAVSDLDQPGALAMMKKRDKQIHLKQEARSLRHTYEQMLIEAQVKLMRSTLETIRRRLAVKMVSYGETKHEKTNYPLFEADLTLVIPDIIMIPSLDDIQKGLNATVTCILCITKTVYTWGQAQGGPGQELLAKKNVANRLDVKNRVRVVKINTEIAGLKNFYRTVSEHKEIQKLVSALSTAVNSTKDLKNTATRQFTKYSHLWTMERNVTMREFIQEVKPTVNEFQTEMSDYSKLMEDISMEPEVMQAGPLALRTEKLIFALTTEARAWVVCYGRTMNNKYQLLMEEVFCSIDDWSKRLSRPLNDMDDIRSVMAALKEIRENEIRIDMSIDPIEVGMLYNYYRCTHAAVSFDLGEL